MSMTMKNTSTISLTIHELAFIQSRTLGRKSRPRLPNASASSSHLALCALSFC